MKRILAGGILITGMLVGWGCGKSEDDHSAHNHGAHQMESTTATPVSHQADKVKTHVITDAEVGLEVKCPVMGTPVTVSKRTLSAEYKGKVYYFCCGECPDEFQKNPDKYAK